MPSPLLLSRDLELDDVNEVASELLAFLQANKVVLFYGEMGSGKTTLIRAICKALGCSEEVSSPTYSLANEYRLGHEKIIHFDFYRLKRTEEALDIGFYDYLDGADYIFIEWPQLIEPLLESDSLSVTLENRGQNQRHIDVTIRTI